MKRYALRLPNGQILRQPTKAQSRRRAKLTEQQAYRAMLREMREEQGKGQP